MTATTTTCATGQYLAQYFTNRTLAGTPVATGCEAAPLNDTLGTTANWPPAGVPTTNFSVRWDGQFSFATAGSYTFTATADDGIRVYLDNALVIDHFVEEGPTTYTYTAANVTAGNHAVKVEYYQGCCGAMVQVGWQAVGTAGAPTATITAPSASLTYKVGDTISYAGSATDPQDGAIPASGLSWQVIFQDCADAPCFRHPVWHSDGPTGSFTIPDAGDSGFFVFTLTAADCAGLKATASVTVRPQTVPLTLATVPSGLQVVYGGTSYTTPVTLATVPGAIRTITAPSPQGGQSFQGWSDGGAAQHNVTVGMGPATYTATFNLMGGGLPSPWVDRDIGTVGTAGSASYSGGTFTVAGSGSDMWDVADSFHYAYQPLTDDGQIVARVASITNTDGWAKAGVMIRETLTADSAHAMMVVTPGNRTNFQWRATTGGASQTTSGPATTAPYWVKLTRSGTTFTGAVSRDGTTWTTVGTATIAMARAVYIGLPVTAHNAVVLNAATFDNVSLSPVTAGGNTPPLITPTITGTLGTNGWYTSDVYLMWSVTDPESTITSKTGCDPVSITTDTTAAGLTFTCTATSAGGMSHKTVVVKRDATPPEASLQFDPATKQLVLIGKDVGAGVPAGPIARSSIKPISWGADDDEQDDANANQDRDDKAELWTYIVTDNAGNTLVLVVKVQLVNERIRARVISLRYNDEAVRNVPKNLLHVQSEVDQEGTLTALTQWFAAGTGTDRQVFDGRLHAKKNETVITIKEKGYNRSETKTGMNLLTMTTTKGTLQISD